MQAQTTMGRPRLAAPPHAPCRGCGGPVERREREALVDFERRFTCSTECAATTRAKTSAEWAEVWLELEALHEPCPICDTKFPHNPDESRSKYVARLCCNDPACKRAIKKRAGARAGGTLPHVCPQGEFVEFEAIDFGDGFRDYVVDPDRSVFRRISPASDARTLGGVSGGWVTR